MIACLGWGSLIWDPRGLAVRGHWRTDGPHGRVEFAGRSKDGRLTLVLLGTAQLVPLLWAEMIPTDLAVACEALRAREGINGAGRADDHS